MAAGQQNTSQLLLYLHPQFCPKLSCDKFDVSHFLCLTSHSHVRVYLLYTSNS